MWFLIHFALWISLLQRFAVSVMKDALILSAGCGGSFLSQWGNVTYPEEFPFRPYPAGLRCRWRIEVPDPSSRVEVTIPYLVLRPTDYLVLMDASLGPMPLKPCNNLFYTEKIVSLFEQRLEPRNFIAAIRGSQVGLDSQEITFTSISNSIIIDFCPSRFLFGPPSGLGLIFLWDELLTRAPIPNILPDSRITNGGSLSDRMYNTVDFK